MNADAPEFVPTPAQALDANAPTFVPDEVILERVAQQDHAYRIATRCAEFVLED